VTTTTTRADGPPRAALAPITAVALGVAGTASVIAAWALVVAAGWVSEASLPAPWSVASGLPRVLSDGVFLDGLADTLASWLAALSIASGSAIALGVLLGTVPVVSRPLMVAINALRSIPSTTLIPVAILLFGLGQSMKIAISTYAVFPIVLINTLYGVANREPMRVDAARMMHWSRLRVYTHLVLPSAAPAIVTGIRVASGISLVVVVSAELLGAKSGAGHVLIRFQQALRIDLAYACVILIGLVGALIYALLSALERLTIRRVHLV